MDDFSEWENEEWVTIDQFPDYAVSSMGRIGRLDSGCIIRSTQTQYGHGKVNLSLHKRRHTRSVAVLVASAFVEAEDPSYTAVIALNGNVNDLRATNLAWRTPSFAWQWAHQFVMPQPEFIFVAPVVEVNSLTFFDSVANASQTLGLLYRDVWSSTIKGSKCYPGGYLFRLARFIDNNQIL